MFPANNIELVKFKISSIVQQSTCHRCLPQRQQISAFRRLRVEATCVYYTPMHLTDAARRAIPK